MWYSWERLQRAPVPSTYCDVVPAPVTVNVPEPVTGELATLNAEGIDNPTLVTVPVLAVAEVAIVS